MPACLPPPISRMPSWSSGSSHISLRKPTHIPRPPFTEVDVRLAARSVAPLVALAATVLFLWPALQPAVGQTHEDWSKNLGIYEVNTRQYTSAGTFNAFAEHLDRIEDLGVGIVWFMPIHPIGSTNRLGSLGSYYSVKDYLDVNPEFGSLDDFRALVADIHSRGMYVLIDWVANHTSWDNVLTTTHPEWYAKDGNGNFIPPPSTNWSDVIELDYNQQGLRDYMIDAMKFWVEDVGVDGFRCDAVSFVPHEFWQEAIAALKTVKPDLLMLAEGDGVEWHTDGFDMTYGWGLYGFESGVLKRIADRTATASNFSGYVATEKTQHTGHYRMYFTSNHDENSWHGTTSELFGNAADLFAVVTATFNGMPLVYGGQEAGLNKRLAFFDKDLIPFGSDPASHPNTALYKTLLDLKRVNKALWNGSSGGIPIRIVTTNNTDVFVVLREADGDRVMAAYNLSPVEQQVTLSGTAYVGAYNDVFSGDAVAFAADASLTLPPWGYAVYANDSLRTSVDAVDARTRFVLHAPYPNPSAESVRLSFTLAGPSEIRLVVYDILGRKRRVVASGSKSAGVHTYEFDTSGLAAGTYFARLTADGAVDSVRFVVER